MSDPVISKLLVCTNISQDICSIIKMYTLPLINKEHYDNDNKTIKCVVVSVFEHSFTFEYFRDGKPKEYYQAIGDKYEGARIVYYDNKNIESRRTYLNGRSHGEQTYYYDNVNVKEIKNYFQGTLEGEYITYFRNGCPHEIRNYHEGKLHGEQLIYSDDIDIPTPLFMNNYYMGLCHGMQKEYFYNGAIRSIDMYDNDKWVYSQLFHLDGTLLYCKENSTNMYGNRACS